MTTCPSCGYENLQGADHCERCQHSLSDLSLPEPQSALEVGLLNDRIRLLKPRPPLSVEPTTSIGKVLSKMVTESIGCVTVVEGDRLVGIFTEHDALHRLNTQVAARAAEPICAVMTPRPIALDIEDKIAVALHAMHVGGYRHLPVLSAGKLVGVTSIRDILNYLAKRVG
jgi:CBS domain-containing protein